MLCIQLKFYLISCLVLILLCLCNILFIGSYFFSLGMCYDGSQSLLCKQLLMCRYVFLMKHYPQWESSVKSLTKNGIVCYKTLKEAAFAYQIAKQKLNQYFIENKYGYWIKKPSEIDNFTIYMSNGLGDVGSIQVSL